MAYNPKDFYFKQAKKEKFAARSVFKLQEIDSRFRLLKPGMLVLDLGAAPGSWSQYAAQKIAPQGKVLGIDLQPIRLTIPNAKFIKADMRDLNLEKIFQENGFFKPFDLVMSDMAPKTTGIRVTDQARSKELCDIALSCALKYSQPGSHFIAKLFHSDEFERFRNDLKKHYEKVSILRPKSTRKESKEIFFIAQNLIALADTTALP